jgi:hypothetical protein
VALNRRRPVGSRLRERGARRGTAHREKHRGWTGGQRPVRPGGECVARGGGGAGGRRGTSEKRRRGPEAEGGGWPKARCDVTTRRRFLRECFDLGYFDQVFLPKLELKCIQG